jgi:hypothetical protein
VTPVAHYPVGYPALLALAYRLLGEHPLSALLLHALIGVLGAVCVHVVAAWGTSRPAGRWAGLAVALHPALLAYTPAIMTEGVCSALLAMPFAIALVARRAWSRGLVWAGALLAGAVLGGVALVRPQVLLLLPLVAWLAGSRARGRGLASPALVIVGVVATTLPWLIRNERAFGRPVLVSANSGWNLLIGTDPAANGAWRPLDVPAECREIWGEVDKDACFGAVARRRIADAPWSWAALIPGKLGATFDLGGSGGSYLSRSRPDLVPRWLVIGLGGIETVFERLAALIALAVLALEPGVRRTARRGVGLVACASLVTPHAWLAYVGLLGVMVLGGWRRLEGEPLRAVLAGVLGATIVTHAVFFGAGRYGLLVYPWVAAMALTGVASRRPSWAGRMNFWRLRRHEG